MGAALGFMMLGELGLALNFQEIGVILLGILGAIILGFLFYRARDLFVIITTAYNGAVQVVYGLGLFRAVQAIGLGQQNFCGSCGHNGPGSLGFLPNILCLKAGEICDVKTPVFDKSYRLSG